jgi:hypothetical protein
MNSINQDNRLGISINIMSVDLTKRGLVKYVLMLLAVLNAYLVVLY